MKDKGLLVFCGICVVPLILGVTREYYFVDLTLNWTEAQQYCREHYTDLATITSNDDINRLNRPGSYTGDTWIGLFLTPVFWRPINDPNTWIWSATGTVSASGYQNWSYIPGYHSGDRCAGILGLYRVVQWLDFYCTSTWPFVCYRDLKGKEFYLVTTPLTWFEALEYCRVNYTDLAMIESASENDKVSSLTRGIIALAWIGLHREPWRWSDGSLSTFTNWTSGRPQGLNSSNCTVEDSAHSWKDVSCDLRLPFFCHNATTSGGPLAAVPASPTDSKSPLPQTPAKKFTVVRIRFSSAGDMSDPRNHKMISQKVEEKLQKTGRSDVSVKWKTPPKKQTSSESKSESCEKNIP